MLLPLKNITPSTTLKQIPLVLVFLLFCGQSESAYAQLPTDATPEGEEKTEPLLPQDSLGRQSPRGTVSGFLNAVANENYNKAARFLNLNEQIQPDGSRLAKILQDLLDRQGNILPHSWISRETSGHNDDDLPPHLDRVGSVSLEEETINIYVERVKRSDSSSLWLFSAETLRKISAADLEVSTPFADRLLPTFLKENTWGGVPIGQWLIMLFLLGLAYLIAWFTIFLLHFIIRRLWHKANTEPTEGVIKALILPIRLFVAVVLFVNMSQAVGISIIARQWFNQVTALIGMLALLLLLWRLTDFLGEFSEKRMNLRGHLSGVSLVLFLRRLAKFMIVIFGLIGLLDSIGIDVTTGLAALGIGGIALALGAQKTVENFVGSVTLVADRPIRVGDFCKAGDTIGTVESIGMRSTRIRTLDRTVVTIPNGEFSSTKIENYAHRDRFRFAPVFGLRYETTADQMRYLLVELRSVLYAHPKVDPDPARVRFAEFGSTSLNVEIFSYINAIDFNDFVEVREDLLLRMMDVVETSGTGFAFPSQTLYLARDKGLSEEKSQRAKEQVKKWREEGEMHIPGFSPDRINELKNSIDYPPEGSSRRKDDTEAGL